MRVYVYKIGNALKAINFDNDQDAFNFAAEYGDNCREITKDNYAELGENTAFIGDQATSIEGNNLDNAYVVYDHSLRQNPSYKELRALEYPPLTELADALVHKENGDSSQYDAYIAECLAVKAKYPKPE